MDYTVNSNPDIGSGSDNSVGNGTYYVTASGLDFETSYTWNVNVHDTTKTTSN